MTEVHSPHSQQAHQTSRHSLGILTLGAIGVVYGDIGTSPLYALREALVQTSAEGISRPEILGVTLGILAGLFAVQARGTAGFAAFFGPIRLGWLGHVWPALTLNCLAQGAMASKALAVAEASGHDHRQPGRDHRRLFADASGHRLGPPAAPRHLSGTGGRSAFPQSTGCRPDRRWITEPASQEP